MTLKQLLGSLTFDEIAPFINLEDGRNCLAAFKQHFDYLRHLTPADGVTGEVIVGYWKDPDLEDGEGEDGNQLFAGSLEGDCWESCLAKEIVLEDGVTASPAEIAGCCLWHTSFYGFLPEEATDTFNRWHEGRGMTQYYRDKFRDILPARKEMLSVPSFHRAIRREMRFHRKHRSGRERREFAELFGGGIRKWRYWKRYEINSEYARRLRINAEFIDNVLERGTTADGQPSRKEFGRLFLANHVSIHRCDTLAYDAAGRMEYLRELVGKYGILDGSAHLPDSFVCISASSGHLLTEEELAEIGILVTSGHGGNHHIWSRNDDSCGEELRVDIAFYEQEPMPTVVTPSSSRRRCGSRRRS